MSEDNRTRGACQLPRGHLRIGAVRNPGAPGFCSGEIALFVEEEKYRETGQNDCRPAKPSAQHEKHRSLDLPCIIGVAHPVILTN